MGVRTKQPSGWKRLLNEAYMRQQAATWAEENTARLEEKKTKHRRRRSPQTATKNVHHSACTLRRSILLHFGARFTYVVVVVASKGSAYNMCAYVGGGVASFKKVSCLSCFVSYRIGGRKLWEERRESHHRVRSPQGSPAQSGAKPQTTKDRRHRKQNTTRTLLCALCTIQDMVGM